MQDLTTGIERKRIFKFAVPMLIGNVFQQLYNVIDSIIVGNFIGEYALAAVGASFPIIFLLISLVLGLSTGATILISQFFGSKDLKKVKLTIDTINITLFISAIIISIIGTIFSKDIFILLQLPKDILPLATEYLDIYLLGFVAFFGFYGISSILRGLGDSKTPLYFLVIATITNIILDLVFIVVLELGVAGAAYATIISQGGAFITAIIYLNKYHKLIRISIFNVKFDKKIFLQSIKIGLPSGIQTSFVALGMMALFGIVNKFGVTIIAAYSVALRIDAFAILPAMAFAMALTTFVGQNIGANKYDRVKVGLISTIKMVLVVTATISLIIVFGAEYLMMMFTKEVDIIRLGAEYLRIVGSFYILFSVMFAVNAVMRGAGDTLIPMFITLFALWFVRIPIAFYLSDIYGEKGIWWSVPIAWAVGLSLSFLYYKTKRWKRMSLVKKQD